MSLSEPQLDALLSRVPAPPPTACPSEATLEAYARDALPAPEAEAVLGHLASCPACRAYWIGLRQPVAAAVRARMEAAAPRATRTVAVWGGLGALAAAAALIFFVFRGVPAAPDYTLEGPWGGVKVMRADSEPASDVFLPHSRLALALKPKAPLAGEAPHASAYIAREGGPLVAVDGALLQPGAGGAFSLEAPAAQLFGTTAGHFTVYLVLDAATPPDRVGQTPEAARAASKAATWLALPVDYRLEVR